MQQLQSMVSAQRNAPRWPVFWVAVAVLLCTGQAYAQAPRPNLVLFIADDLGLVECSPYARAGGPTPASTPHMQRLAAAGLTFSHAFVASPSCAPNRASLLTGLHIARHGAINNHDQPRSDVKKWPAYFRELGYEVVAFGKVAHYKQTIHYGFDSFNHDGYHDQAWTSAAVQFLRTRSRDNTRPLCLIVGTNWPHVPWPVQPEGYDPDTLRLPPTLVDTPATRRAYARYLTAVTLADQHLGTIYDAAQKHLDKNTLFVFTSDHGPQLPFSKWNCYDAGVRVPLIAAWPAVIEPGTHTSAMVSWIDLLPTFVHAAGGQPPRTGAGPEEIDGRSFLPVLHDRSRRHRHLIFTAHNRDKEMNVYPIRSARSGDWNYIRNLTPEARHTTHIDKLPDRAEQGAYWPSWLAAAKTDTRAATLIQRYHTRPAEELYDLIADPFEQKNLAADPAHAQRLGEMRAALDAWMVEYP